MPWQVWPQEAVAVLKAAVEESPANQDLDYGLIQQKLAASDFNFSLKQIQYKVGNERQAGRLQKAGRLVSHDCSPRQPACDGRGACGAGGGGRGAGGRGGARGRAGAMTMVSVDLYACAPPVGMLKGGK
jgi:hypothetical protein